MFFEESDRRSSRPSRWRNPVRRFLPDPWWSRLKRGLIALAGVAAAIVGIGSGNSGDGKIIGDVSLLFFLTALTSPVWREAERDVGGQVRWRELLSRILWRSSVVLLYGSIAGLIAYRWFTLRGDLPAAHVSTVSSVTCLLLAVVPPPLGPLLWRRFPEGLRRVERTTRLMEELGKPAATKPGRVRLELSPRAATFRAMTTQPKSTFEFDPGLGASGRPKALDECLPVTPGSRGSAQKLRPTAQIGSVVKWADGAFTVIGGQGERIRFPVASSSSSSLGASWSAGSGSGSVSAPAAAEIVLLESRWWVAGRGTRRVRASRLLFLNERGFRFLEIAQFTHSWRETMRVAAAANVTLRSYSVDCTKENVGTIRDLMFPKCTKSRSVNQ